jgi:hypothetical protein
MLSLMCVFPILSGERDVSPFLQYATVKVFRLTDFKELTFSANGHFIQTGEESADDFDCRRNQMSRFQLFYPKARENTAKT